VSSGSEVAGLLSSADSFAHLIGTQRPNTPVTDQKPLDYHQPAVGCLCLGGPEDGRYYYVPPEARTWRVMVREPLADMQAPPGGGPHNLWSEIGIRTFWYKRAMIEVMYAGNAWGHDFLVPADADASPAAILEKLIIGYRNVRD
jgi:hypothetical protein